MIGDYPAHHEIQDLKQENAALAGLLEKGLGQAMGQEIATLMQQATEYMRRPTVFAFGFGEVLIGLGTKGETPILTLRDSSQPLPIGPLSEEMQTEVRIDRDTTILSFANVEGLDVLISSALKLREIMTGAPSPSEQVKQAALQFIWQHQISCAEATTEDRVYEHAPGLIEDLAEVVGYYVDPDEA